MRKQAISDSNLTGAELSDDGQTAELAGSLGQTSQSRHHHPGQPSGTEYRSIDGSGNNLSSPALNAAGTDFARIGPAHFADGVDSMRDGPNPRMISNVVVGQGDADVPNAEGLSGLMYAWGQFLDHDLDLSRSDGVTHIDIPIPNGDPNYPDGSSIPLTRAIIDPATGHDGKPAAAVNSITGWLDASMVYGSDQATAHSLRTADGHMKTSAGNNLPINADGTFAAGDVRAQENPSLTALQTLFVREHNYQVDQLHRQNPNWTGDHLYEQARAIVAGEIQNITYSEFLPHLLGPGVIPAYGGYDPHVDPRITEEFAGAAFRFGHSIVSDETERVDEHGAVTGPSLELQDTFFLSATDFTANGGADGFLRHLGSDPSQAMDARIVDGLRNFLFDPPAGQDLAAINIERGRDLGLGTLNETRHALGLPEYTSFEQITDDQGTVQALKDAFGSVDKVDLWTGGLSERHMTDAMIGSTFGAIIAMQFENLRDGDRFYFENQLDARTVNQIEHTTLADIIERDTDTQHMQDDAFVFYNRHSGTAGGVASEDPDAHQLVIGSNGTDTLIGGPQADVLVAGNGHQTMTGNAGADTFVFDKGATSATITDFKPGVDHLEFDSAGRLDFHDVHVRSDHGNTVLDVGADHIVLAGVSPNQLSPHDFIFHI
jgi:Ca2+-binding RTX toxin-like protein